MTAVATKISSWGNSEAVRIPRSLLRLVGLVSGDKVDLMVNERNNIELVRKETEHRCIQPERGVTFGSLFAGYEPHGGKAVSAWPDDDLMGAEYEAWSR